MQYNNNTHIIFTKNLVELVDIFHKKIALLLIEKKFKSKYSDKKIKSKNKTKKTIYL